MKSWFSIKNTSATEATIELYDEIGMFGVTAKDFLTELKSVGSRKIILRINSPGGEVFDGLAIFNRLKEHKGGVEVRIDGIAASMASVIAMCGQPVKMASNALLMIHNPSGLCMGDADDMRDLADMLDKVRGSLTGAYESKTGKSAEEILAMMQAETWLNADEALEMGFCDEITGSMQIAAKFDRLKSAEKILMREKSLDVIENNRINENQMSEPTIPAVAEPTVPAVTPPVTPVAEVIDAAQIRASAIADERNRVSEIRAWAGDVMKVQNVDLSEAITAHIESGKTLAEFKDFVITNTFKPKTVATATDTTGAQGNTMKREDFNKLSPFNQSDFCRKGGKITD